MTETSQKASTTRRVGERESRVVHTRFSSSELVAVEAAAHRAGMTISAFIRSLTLDGAGILPFLTEEDRAVFDLLHRDLVITGETLNNLVRRSHQRAIASDAADHLTELSLLVAGVMLELRRLSTHSSRSIKGTH